MTALVLCPKRAERTPPAHPEVLKPGREGVAEVVEMEVLDLGCLTGLVPLMAEGIGRPIGEMGSAVAAIQYNWSSARSGVPEPIHDIQYIQQ